MKERVFNRNSQSVPSLIDNRESVYDVAEHTAMKEDHSRQPPHTTSTMARESPILPSTDFVKHLKQNRKVV